MNYYIITGTSRGLGEAIANQLISSNNFLFCISRKLNEKLAVSSNVKYFEYDLNDVSGIEQLLTDIFNNIDLNKVESISLINNAGVVNPMKPIGKCDSNEMISNININTISPMLLTNGFIKLTENLNCEKTIINISSGAGKKPYFGWGSYCTSKAAIDMFTQCVGLEQSKKDYPVKIYSFSPGIIDTNMQLTIRTSAQEDFEQVERFKKFKEEGNLRDPNFVADKVIQVLNNKDLINGSILDIKDFIK